MIEFKQYAKRAIRFSKNPIALFFYNNLNTVATGQSRQELCAKTLAGSGRMRSAGNRGAIQSRL